MGGRSDAKELPLSVNLLQQTPLDRGAGDVLVRGARVMRLLEFKRLANDSDKEAAKLIHLQRALSDETNADLIPVSREVHWFIGSRNQDTLDLRIVPYLDFQDMNVRGPDLRGFIDAMVSEAAHSTSDKSATFSRYLQVVAQSQGSIKGSSGGLIVSIDDSGTVNYAVVEDLRELGLKLTKLHNMYLQRQIERQQQYELQWSRSFSGPERGGLSL